MITLIQREQDRHEKEKKDLMMEMAELVNNASECTGSLHGDPGEDEVSIKSEKSSAVENHRPVSKVTYFLFL